MLENLNTFKILELFFNSPEKSFHIRQISRLTALSAPAVSSMVRSLKKENILRTKKEKGVLSVYAERERPEFLSLKRFYNLYKLYRSGLVEFMMDKYNEPEAIVLFGSFSDGTDISSSDIDIAILTKRNLQPDLRKFEKNLKRKIALHEIKIDKCTKEFINNLANGIVLHGYLKVV